MTPSLIGFEFPSGGLEPLMTVDRLLTLDVLETKSMVEEWGTGRRPSWPFKASLHVSISLAMTR